jgi:farnesyl-diphosphate farnesyltransferase
MPARETSSTVPAPDLDRLLKGNSRSFYLSIRLLPAPLRRPIGVAYLLARAADTLADTARAPVELRSKNLAHWAAAVAGRLPGPQRELRAIAESFAPLQTDPRERELVLALPHCLAALTSLAPADRADVRAVLAHITRGQMLDLQRFCDPAATNALETAEQLDEYTWLVAGCVGEFWTDLCARHLAGFATLPAAQMRELGRHYGQALQLVNILRDQDADMQAGRNYLPAHEIAQRGLAAVRRDWLAKARAGLAQGMNYADAVNSRRVRAACALPALIGIRTLARMQDAHLPPKSFANEATQSTAQGLMPFAAKVPRAAVRSLLARIAFSLAGRGTLRELWREAAAAIDTADASRTVQWDNRRR